MHRDLKFLVRDMYLCFPTHFVNFSSKPFKKALYLITSPVKLESLFTGQKKPDFGFNEKNCLLKI